MRALDAVSGLREDLAAGRDVAGQRNHPHLRVLREWRADAAAAAADDVHDASRENLREQLTELQRGERRLLGRLQHDRVARRERRAELPGRHHERVVPRRDRRHDADRVAADHAGEPGKVFARNGTCQGPTGAGEEAEHVGDRGDLVVERGRQRLAAVLRFHFREPSAIGLDAVRELQQEVRAVLRRSASPARERRVSRFHRHVDLGARRFGNAGQHLAGGRVQHVFDLAFACDEFAVDQESGLHGCAPVREGGVHWGSD